MEKNIRFQESLKYFRRDALAGAITGFMAVPLTVGICLMSEYPVMMGLYTVIFATVVSFVTYLFKPGNYTGTPGVAAGLAPVLALGIHTFGFENMPFLVFLTSTFQAVVWKFKLERYILKIVPHYLVEGLLAGVGLKIAIKFVPFLYEMGHEHEIFPFERGMIIVLSLVSFTLFVLLFRYYKKRMPAIPYFAILSTGVVLSFLIPLSMLSIEPIPFEVSLPLPYFGSLGTLETGIMIVKMVGFAMMLGVIDVIEQVMSNVAIEKMDSLRRKADSNNSLLAIWIANIGASFFGGMTNLDGLAKSTTNTVAGAVTKLSNLFTGIVLAIFILFPELLTHIPKYALGIIMVYSGWKMIANIAHVRAEGRYALVMAGICGLLVFMYGIFEGLLIVLLAHSIVQIVFLKRIGRSNQYISKQFRDAMRDKPETSQEAEEMDLHSEPEVPVFRKWLNAFNAHDLNRIMELYTEESLLQPGHSRSVRKGIAAIRNYHASLFALKDCRVRPVEVEVRQVNDSRIDSGSYKISWTSQGMHESDLLRFSMIVNGAQIIVHHASLEPVDDLCPEPAAKSQTPVLMS